MRDFVSQTQQLPRAFLVADLKIERDSGVHCSIEQTTRGRFTGTCTGHIFYKPVARASRSHDRVMSGGIRVSGPVADITLGDADARDGERVLKAGGPTRSKKLRHVAS